MRKLTTNPLLPAISLGFATSFSVTLFAAPALEEVVVTANKRAESINDVGIAISAIGRDQLSEQQLTSLEEISSAVPGLVYSASTANTPIFTLRGIGFNEQTLGAYPATSLYLDEAPMPFPVLASHSAYDLERVEVLKGPQGILFGQNSTGGAINFIAAKPGDEFEAGADVSYGRFNTTEMNGYVSGPLTDTLSARMAFSGVKGDDWQKSASRNAENGAEEYYAGRLILKFEPTDTASYMLNVNGWKDKTDPQAQQLVAINPQVKVDAAGDVPATLPAVEALPFTKEDPRAADWSPEIDPSSDRDYYQIIARGDWNISDTMTLTALSTYQDFTQTQETDGDGVPLVLFDLKPVDGDIDTWITEVRLTGDNDSFKWVVGANYEDSNTSEKETLRYWDSTNYNAANAYINTSGISLEQDITNYAVFGNVDYNLSDDWTLKLGARYTDSSNEVASCNYASPNQPGTINAGDGANVATLFNYLGDALGSVPFTPIGVNDCYTLNDNSVPGDVYKDKLDEDNTSWRVGLDYALNDDTLVYGNIAQGYKAGSFPALAAANFFQLDPVSQEKVIAYELGFKASLAENTIQFNGATFFYTYDDKQLRTKTVDPIFGLLDVLDNVPGTEIFGVETDITALVTDGLTLKASVTYLDSEVTDYKNGVAFTGETGVDFDGENIPFTPEWTYSLDADYRFTIDSGATVFAGVTVTGQSESEAAFGAKTYKLSPEQLATGSSALVSDFMVMDSYTVINARLGYESADGHWKIMAWGKNLDDEYYVTNVIGSSDTSARFVGRPRTYGLTLGYTF